MKKMSIALLAALSLAAVGCRKDKGGEAIARMTEIKVQMCACKDKACSEKVSEALVQWDQAQEKAAGDKPVALSGEAAEKMEAVRDEISTCLLKLEVPGGAGGTMGSGRPAAGSADGSAAAGAAPAAGSAH
jgi:hypothetical protein